MWGKGTWKRDRGRESRGGGLEKDRKKKERPVENMLITERKLERMRKEGGEERRKRGKKKEEKKGGMRRKKRRRRGRVVSEQSSYTLPDHAHHIWPLRR